MANQTFVDFDLRTQLLSGDYLVGYKEDGTTELRTKVGDVINLVPRANLTDIQSNSGNWQNTYSTVRSLSTTWAIDNNANLSEIAGASGKWNSSFTSVNSNSANWTDVATTVRASSGSWNSTYTSVNANSANWSNTTSTVRSNSADWKHANRYLPLSGGVLTGFVTITGNNGQGTNLRIIDGLSIGYSAGDFGPTNDGAELYMDYSAGPDQGVFYFTTRDNGEEPIVFRQRHDWTAPSYQFEPLIIGSNHTVGINAPTGTRSFGSPLTVYGNISASGDVYTDNLFTNKSQSIYEGRIAPYYFLTNNEIRDYNRLGRFTMIKVRNLDGNKIRFVETQTNRFKFGDVVGVWFQNTYSSTNSQLYLPVEYVPYNGSPIPIGTIKGGWGYNEASAYFKFTGTTFLSGDPVNNTDINVSGIASELRVEYIEPKDPGEPFSVIGRGSLVHGLTLKAGDQKFTNGSDHFHLIQAGGNGDPLLFWQYLNGGYQHTTQRLAIHTLAQRGPEVQFRIVAANSINLSADQVNRPFGVKTPGVDYLAAWISDYNGSTTFNVGNWVFMSVSPAGTPNTSLRGIGFTAASYPCKIVANNAIGSAQSNADIPLGYTLPANANRHLRLEPVNLTVDNWVNGGGAFSNTLTNAGEVFRAPSRTLVSPLDQRSALSALGGYDTIEVKNGCEIVLNFTTTPLLSSQLQFLYEGASVILYTGTNNTLSANNYDGLNYAKTGHGLQVDLNPSSPNYGNFTSVKGTYDQQTYDGYIYHTSPNKIVVRIGLLPGLGECRLQKIPAPNPTWYSGILPGYSSLTFTNPPNNDPEINGLRITSNPGGINAFGNPGAGLWGNAYTGVGYTMPTIMKTGIEFLDLPPTSYTQKQVYLYFGNKDPVHRPIASHQTWHFERYPTINPDFKQTGGIVSKFGIGPSCEGFDIETAAIGFGSTAYHRRSMAIGHKVETLSAGEMVLGIDDTTLRIGNSALTISPTMLSSNGIDTFLKIRNSNNNIMYGLKLQVIG